MAIRLSVKHSDEQLSRGMKNWMISRGILAHGNAKTTVRIHSWMFFFTSRVRMSHCHVCLVGQKHSTCLPIWNHILLITLRINAYKSICICLTYLQISAALRRSNEKDTTPRSSNLTSPRLSNVSAANLPTYPNYSSVHELWSKAGLESWKAGKLESRVGMLGDLKSPW